MPPESPPALPSLTALRAFAAFGVFFSHCSPFLGSNPPGELMAISARSGVTFFFVLSGAILAYNYPRLASAARFYRKRFARIYPVYAVAFVLGAVVVWAQSTGGLPSAWQTLTNLTMTTGWVPGDAGEPIPRTAWTLSCEMLFYALFPVLLVTLRRLPDRAAPAVATVLLAFAFAGPGLVYEHLVDDAFFLSPLVHLPEFALGIVLGLHLPRLARDPRSVLRRRSTELLTACAVVPLAIVVAFDLPEWPNPWVPFCVLAILAAASADHAGAHWLSHRNLVLAGLWSYAFYSVHAPLINVVDGVLPSRPGLALGLPLGIATFVGIGIASALVYRLWEEPMRRRLTRSVGRPHPAAGPAAHPALTR